VAHKDETAILNAHTGCDVACGGGFSLPVKPRIEWDRTTKGVTTKLHFPKVADRLKLKINVSPNLKMMVTGHEQY